MRRLARWRCVRSMDTSERPIDLGNLPGRGCSPSVEQRGPADAAASGYATRIVPVPLLRATQRTAMAQLYLASYEATSESTFLRDLAVKDEALLLYSAGQLVGFTTLRFYERSWEGETRRIVYSGDTVVERDHWGQQSLAFAWIQRLGQLWRERPGWPLYWFLLVKGHRTFRFLPAFAHSFYPHWREQRADLRSFAAALATDMFPGDYNPATGVIEFEPSRGQLRSDIAEPNDAARTRADVEFFLARNPGYSRGHELVCVCELVESNLKPLARRLFRKPLHAA